MCFLRYRVSDHHHSHETLPCIRELLLFIRRCINPLKLVQCLLAPLLSCSLTCLQGSLHMYIRLDTV